MRIKMLCARLICGCSLRNEMSSMPSNAGAHLLSEAGATQERRLEAVRCPGRIGEYSTNPPTEPYVKMSLIRFLGTARFHTARLPDIADNPRHLSPSALQHTSSQWLCVPGDLPGTIPPLARSWAAAAGTLPSSAHTRAMASSGLHGGSASTATRAVPPRTPGRGLGCCTARRHTGRTLAASHTVRRTVPGVHGGGCPGTNARTRPGCGGAACPPSSVGWCSCLARFCPSSGQRLASCKSRAGARLTVAGGDQSGPLGSSRCCSPARPWRTVAVTPR
jgi:hypothetical protein